MVVAAVTVSAVVVVVSAVAGLIVVVVVVVPKKVELLIRFFEPFGSSRVFHFFLGTFAKVGGLPGLLGASDEFFFQSELDISGSVETMQIAVASIV